MSVTLPEVRVGEPVRFAGLSVFPLFSESTSSAAYRLSDEAIADRSVVVEEVSQSGSVPELFVENKGDVRVLFLEGELLVGAKQNRVLNTSILVRAKTKVKIPVSCVEQGRWRYRSAAFGHSGYHSPSKLRYALKRSVTASTREDGTHRSDQGEVWSHVAKYLCAHAVSSTTGALDEVFETKRKQVAEFRTKATYAPGATGMAVAVGGRVVAVDVFDKPSTCEKVWDRMLSGCLLDVTQADSEAEAADKSAVERLLKSAQQATWKQIQSVGEGEEHRAQVGEDHASVLSLQGTVVHGSVLARS